MGRRHGVVSSETEWYALVVLADGTTSLYTSGLLGIIGGGAHETVREAGRLLWETAADRRLELRGNDRDRVARTWTDRPAPAHLRRQRAVVGTGPSSATGSTRSRPCSSPPTRCSAGCGSSPRAATRSVRRAVNASPRAADRRRDIAATPSGGLVSQNRRPWAAISYPEESRYASAEDVARRAKVGIAVRVAKITLPVMLAGRIRGNRLRRWPRQQQ